MKTSLIFVLVLALSVSSFSQKKGQDKIDSLLLVAKNSGQDSVKAKAFNELSSEFKSSDPDTAVYFANEALLLATKANYKVGIANAYTSLGAAQMNSGKFDDALKNDNTALTIYDELLNTQNGTKKNIIASYKARVLGNIGTIYNSQGNYPEALKNNYAALKIREDIKDTVGLAASYNNIGNINIAQGNYAEGLKNFFAALKIKEQIGDKKSLANAYNNIGSTYYNQHDYSQALKYHLQALKIRQEINDQRGISSSYSNIGIIYDDNGNYTMALKYQFEALKIQTESEDVEGLVFTYDNIGLVYLHQKNYSEALKYFLKYLKTAETLEDKSSIADAYINLGTVYMYLKNISNASLYLNKGLLLAKEVGSVDFIKSAYEALSQLDSAQGNYKRSLEYYKLFIINRDSLFNDENTKKLVQSQMQYEFDKKETLAKEEQEKKDAETKRVKNLQYFTIAALGILVLAVVIIAFIQYRHSKDKQTANTLLQQQNEKIEATLNELKSTQAQLIQSEKMASLGELTAGIAHEIQNPLNFVNNFAEVNTEMINDASEEILQQNYEEVKNILNNIKNNSEKINYHGKRADAIVKGMLQHSRQTKGIKEATDINALCDEYLRLAYHGLRAKDKSFNADIQTTFDPSIGKINIVPQDIGRVLINFYNNAFYAVAQKKSAANENYKPTVSIQTKKLNNNIQLTIQDNGTGISPKVIEKIFQPFYTTKPTGQGTGLGLSLSYDIIKSHNGEINVQSKEGEGTTFIIMLPA